MRRGCRRGRALALLGVAALVAFAAQAPAATATSGGDPYVAPTVVDTNPAADVVETTLVSQEATVGVGDGVVARAQTYNGAIPGPTFRLNVGDSVIVHYRNQLGRPSGIDWHGIEVSNAMDGTSLTQDQVPPGGTFLYKFRVTRPGIFWYRPHHPHATNEVFKGLYGMVVVADPNEPALMAAGTLPPLTQTRPFVLSDMTVCKAPGSNDAATYSPALPHVSGGALPAQPPPTPLQLCETAPLDEGGAPRGPFAAGDIPNIKTAATAGRTNEGQTVLTNGVNVGGRGGSPAAPGALAPGASTLPVVPGQGLRLNLLNAATTRYFRLRLTTSTGALVPLTRVGGEGGLMDSAVLEGGVTPGGFDTQYALGELLLPPGSRADVVAAIPQSASGVLTLWTQDYLRTGIGYSNIPTVPVAHLAVSGTAGAPYTLAPGTPLRQATGNPVEVLGTPNGALLNPALFTPAKPGSVLQNIRLTTSAGVSLGIDDVFGAYTNFSGYGSVPHLGSTRYATPGQTLGLAATNQTGAHQPFHLHGFTIQPLSLTRAGFPTYTWPYREFRDTVDIPAGYTLNFRVRLDDRMLADGVTGGGALGRWLFESSIFFIAQNGMRGELVVVADATGNEKPYVNANGSEVAVGAGATATMQGTYGDPDGDPVTLTASRGTVAAGGGGTWSWSGAAGTSGPVYITATDSGGAKDQAVFMLTVAGSGTGPPPNAGDTVAPAVSRVTLSRTRFRVGRRATPIAARRRPAAAGTTVGYRLSEAAKVTFTIERMVPGRVKRVRGKRRCVKPTRALVRAKAKRCTRPRPAGKLTRTAKLGSNKVAFSGRVGRRALRPGKHRLSLRATDAAGNTSKPVRRKFTIVRR